MPENGDSRFTTGELQFASWWVRNQIIVRRALHGVLIGFSALFWGYAIWGLLDAYAISYPRESRITRQIAVNQQLLTALQSDQPQNVSLSDVVVTQTTDGRYDLSVEATNPNAQWWAEFNYHFSLSGEETPVRSGYILPNGTQVLTELGYRPSSKGGRSASFLVDNVRWHRVDPAKVGGIYKDFLANRMNFKFDKIAYDTNIALGSSAVGQTSFTMTNASSYGFWSVDLIVRLYRGAFPVAINDIKVTNIKPGEVRPIQMTWLDNIPSVTRTEIIPQINILDSSVYLPTQYFK